MKDGSEAVEIPARPMKKHGGEMMAQASAIVRDAFAEVWVLWEHTAYSPWRRGTPVTTILRPPGIPQDATGFTPTPFSALFRDTYGQD